MEFALPLFLGCLFASAFFSGSEVAMLSASRLKLRRYQAQGDRTAERILALVENPRRLLAGILVGNNIVNTLATGVATAWCAERFGAGPGLAIATPVTVVLLVIFAEYLPKAIAAVHPIGFSRVAVRPLSVLLVVLTPAVRPLVWLTRPLGRLVGRSSDIFGLAEVHSAVSEGVRTGAVEGTMERVLRGGLSLEWKRIADVLVPRVDVSAIDANADYATCLDAFRTEGYSRMLVMEGTPDADVGYLAAKDFLNITEEQRAGWTARGGARQALRVPATTALQDLLLRMRQSGIHFAVVKDEYGGTEGIVTLEDVLEELVGEIRDEHDSEETPPVRPVKPGVWAVRGDVSVKDLESRLGLTFAAEESRTIGGFVAEELGRVPREQDLVVLDKFRVRVLQTDENRVLLVRVTRTG